MKTLISILTLFVLIFAVVGPSAAEKKYTPTWSLHAMPEGGNATHVLALRIDFAEGYFTYSHTPGSEFAMPLDVTISSEPGGSALSVGYPEGVAVHYNLLGTDVMVHRTAPTLFVPLDAEKTASVRGMLKMLICSKESCRPAREKFEKPISAEEYDAAEPLPEDLAGKLERVVFDPPR